MITRLGVSITGSPLVARRGLVNWWCPVLSRGPGLVPLAVRAPRSLSVRAACGVLTGALSTFAARRRGLRAEGSQRAVGNERHPVTGLPPGPYPVGVTTLQFDDHARQDPDGGPRSLQTEIWYPAADDAHELPPNRYSDFLSCRALGEFVKLAEDADAIGGYRQGLTIDELDVTWKNLGKRDARVRAPASEGPWPVVIFSHGSGAFRASYVYFTEFLASQGFVVVACDHAGSSRYTILNGKVVKGGGPRLESSQADRPQDLLFLLDSLERLNLGADSRFAGRLDTGRCAVTGMSFGGWTAAKVADMGDTRIKAAVLQCPSLARGTLGSRVEVPVLVMLGAEDTVIGVEGNKLCREYFANATGPSYLVEIKAGGHVTFSSCEQYNRAYGNGIGSSRSLTKPGETYEPLPPEEAHAAINFYTLAFLDTHLRGRASHRAVLEQNHFQGDIVYSFKH